MDEDEKSNDDFEIMSYDSSLDEDTKRIFVDEVRRLSKPFWLSSLFTNCYCFNMIFFLILHGVMTYIAIENNLFAFNPPVFRDYYPMKDEYILKAETGELMRDTSIAEMRKYLEEF